ncbi:MAG: T9SS type A sorting domain-containing protein [Ignavibacteriales bacterium]
MKTARMFICMLFLYSALLSAPMFNVPVVLKQPDGTLIRCFASGDEFFNYTHDQNGIAIVRDNSGYYVYADCIDDELKLTGYRPGSIDPARTGLHRFSAGCGRRLYKSSPALTRQADFGRSLSDYSMGIGKSLAQGSLNNICIFIRFADEGEFNDNIAKFDTISNSTFADAYSLRNYYRTISFNKLEVISHFYPESRNNMVMSFRDSNPRGYYRKYNENSNPGGYQGDEGYLRLALMLNNMVDSVRSLIPASLDIDMNNDGRIDNLCFIVSGFSEGWSDPLWPHCGWLAGDKIINGKKAQVYNLQLQGWFTYSTLSHELFHSLGSPDLYHYSYNGPEPVGNWDIMAYGSGHPLVYMKCNYGLWVDSIPAIYTSGRYTLKPAVKTGSAFIINSPSSTKEFFVVEFRRQKDMFEHNIYGTGLVIYRINAEQKGNSGGPPDMLYVYRFGGTSTQNGNLYVSYFSDLSTSGIMLTSINDTTNPSGFLTNGSPGGLNISDIRITDDSASFKVYVRPALALSYPGGGQVFSGSSRHRIKWRASNFEQIKIEFSSDNGSSWQTIEKSISAEPGGYDWRVPDISAEFCRIRLSNAANPALSATSPSVFLIKPLKLQSMAVVNSICIEPPALRTAVVSDYLYVATENGLHIFNKENPYDPVEVASLFQSHSVNNLAIEGSLAYVQWYVSWPYDQMLTILDISDPASPVTLGEFPNLAEDIIVKDKIIYLPSWDEMQIVDARNPADPKMLKVLPSGANIAAAIHGNYCYMGTSRGLKYFDISDPAASVILNPEDSTENVSAMAVLDNYLYTLSLRGMVVYEFGPDGKPVERYTMNMPVNPGFSSNSQLYAEKNSLFAAYETAGFGIYNITNRLKPVLSCSFTAYTRTRGFASDERYFYLANNIDGVYIVADPPHSGTDEGAPAIAHRFSLEQNYPNPFNPATTIRYSVEKNGRVTLKVYDILGKETATLVDEYKTAGSYLVQFNGSGLSSGIYIYRLTSGEFTGTRKLILLK